MTAIPTSRRIYPPLPGSSIEGGGFPVTTLAGVTDGIPGSPPPANNASPFNPISGRVITPGSDTENGYVFRRPSSTYGAFAGSPPAQRYGVGQAFLAIKDGAGNVNADLVLARIDGRTGAGGFAGGLHSAAGLHRESGDPVSTQNLWVQNYDDMTGVVVSAVSDSPAFPYQLWLNHSGVVQAAVLKEGILAAYTADPSYGSMYVSSYPGHFAAMTMGVGGSAVEGVIAISSASGQSGSTDAGQMVLRNLNNKAIVFTIGSTGVMALDSTQLYSTIPITTTAEVNTPKVIGSSVIIGNGSQGLQVSMGGASASLMNTNNGNVALELDDSGALYLYPENGDLAHLYTPGGGDAFSWGYSGGQVRCSHYGNTIVAQQTVTGSRSGGAALTNLLTALANWGAIIDATTA